MPVVAAVLTLVVQISFAYHVFKTGRPYWWIFVIMSFPLVGCVIYYLVEIFPNSRDQRVVRKSARDISKTLLPDRDLRRRVEDVRICGSVDNKVALARECVECGMFDDAIGLYESCLTGLYANDPDLSFALAKVRLLNCDHDQVRELVDSLLVLHPAFRRNEVKLLRARALEGVNDLHAALAEYENIIDSFAGLEARCRYGLLLKRLGHVNQAAEVLSDVVMLGKRYAHESVSQTEWVSLARQNLE
jgi:hypothetical protein